MELWNKLPDGLDTNVELDYYKAIRKTTDATIVILPGGAYLGLADHEGEGYARYFNTIGMDAFVLKYRVYPYQFPIELLDARRAIRYVRYHAKEYGIDPKKIIVMGSSAGGHLASLLCTYRDKIEYENVDEIDEVDYLPNAQILCYPVINLTTDGIRHYDTAISLLGKERQNISDNFCAHIIADEQTPKAFIWHTADDDAVNVINSYQYATKLREVNVPVEMHIFPNGYHGLGLSLENPHVSQCVGLMKNCLIYNKLI